jgi:hypothetical protein
MRLPTGLGSILRRQEGGPNSDAVTREQSPAAEYACHLQAEWTFPPPQLSRRRVAGLAAGICPPEANEPVGSAGLATRSARQKLKGNWRQPHRPAHRW